MSNENRIEVNPGEMFLVSPNLVLAESYESVFAMTGKIGLPTNQPAYLATFSGRKNNTVEQETFTVAMSLIDAWNFCSTMLEQFEWLQQQNKEG